MKAVPWLVLVWFMMGQRWLIQTNIGVVETICCPSLLIWTSKWMVWLDLGSLSTKSMIYYMWYIYVLYIDVECLYERFYYLPPDELRSKKAMTVANVYSPGVSMRLSELRRKEVDVVGVWNLKDSFRAKCRVFLTY